jgi:DHA2 family multidrug resistance protein
MVKPIRPKIKTRTVPKRVFIFGLIGFTIFSFLCGLANSLGMLVFFRIGQNPDGSKATRKPTC